MLYREIIAVWSENHTKHTQIQYEQNTEFLSLKLSVNTQTIMFIVLNPPVQCTELSRSSLPPSGGSYKTVIPLCMSATTHAYVGIGINS